MGKKKLELTWYNKEKALIPSAQGKYSYRWVEINDPRYCETHTLVIDEYIEGKQSEKTQLFDYSERADYQPQNDNLLIKGESGDVLEAFTRVPELVNKYVGQIKLVYIDPPFNTGQTFSNYEDNLEHSIWLTMMRDRLLNIKKLLCKDGSIWVHLDDVEVHRMRCLMDEIFGQENFVAQVSWLSSDSSSNNAKGFSKDSNWILVYGKSRGWRPAQLPDPEKQGHYSNPDNDPRGPWFDGHNVQNPKNRENLKYIIHAPNGNMIQPPTNGWRWEWSTIQEKMKTNEIYFNKTMTGIKRKTYLREQEGLPPSDFWKSIIQTGSTRQAKNHLKQLFPGVPTPSLFDTPKPEKLLQYILELASSPGDIILDCFAGSGTTAAVAQKMGRRWGTCELNEDTFERFTKPRLMKVINDQDPGEISRSEGERIAAEGVDLPDGVSPVNAQIFTSVLNKILSENTELKKSAVVNDLKALTKTKKTKEIINWRGGGGFNIARLSPTCFNYDEKIKRVTLSEYATGFPLISSVAAHLRFKLTPTHPYFDGIRGRMRLKVYEGVLTAEEVDYWTLHLDPEEKLLFAATGIMEGVREHIRNKKIGSSVVHIPDDLFTFEEEGDN